MEVTRNTGQLRITRMSSQRAVQEEQEGTATLRDSRECPKSSRKFDRPLDCLAR